MFTTPLPDIMNFTTHPQMVYNSVVHLQVVDYVILVIMLLFSLAVGVYFAFFGTGQQTPNEYFKGNSNMPIIPLVLSIMASFLSSNGMLGVPAEVYLHGMNYWFLNIGSIAAIPVVAYFFIPVFYDLKITSVYEYLERRFDKRVRCVGAVLSVLTTMIYASFVTYGPALALSQVTGLNLWGSILTTIIIGSIYTSLGGIKAVIWADSAQLVVFTIALVVVLIQGFFYVGGFSEIISKAYDGQRLEPLSLSFDPRVRFTLWGCVIGSFLGWTGGYGTTQIQVQRYLASPTRKLAQRSLWYNYPGMVVVSTLYCFLGLMLYAVYWNCDPMKSRQIQQADQIFPLFAIHATKSLPGIPGLFVAGVYSASLSTISSQLNSLAAITLEDFIRPFYKKLSDAKATKISKYIALGYGGLCLVAVTGITNLGSILQAIVYLAGGGNGSSLAIFTLGMMVPWSNSEGTLIGMLAGLMLGWWISLGNQINKPRLHYHTTSTEGCNATLGNWTQFVSPTRSDDVLEIYKISYVWILPLSWLTTMLVGSIASKFIGKPPTVDPSLFSPPIRKWLKKKTTNATNGDSCTNGIDIPVYKLQNKKGEQQQPNGDIEEMASLMNKTNHQPTQ